MLNSAVLAKTCYVKVQTSIINYQILAINASDITVCHRHTLVPVTVYVNTRLLSNSAYLRIPAISVTWLNIDHLEYRFVRILICDYHIKQMTLMYFL